MALCDIIDALFEQRPEANYTNLLLESPRKVAAFFHDYAKNLEAK